MEFKKVEEGIVPIYENDTNEKLINARELHQALKNKRQFANWIKQRIDQYGFLRNLDFVTFNKFVKRGESNLGTKIIEYYITIDMAKELCMVENNEMGRKIRRYFIEAEKRYREIINNPSNIFDFMRLALNQIELNS
ncbi:MAG: antA/AntB antirepressor family protein, partial [Clostridia bacterium]|nr:antA/AntB antirepressor family protein [Clostridia bacterium]